MTNRKEQLLALAQEGNEEAASDLYKEFGITFPINGKSKTTTTKEKRRNSHDSNPKNKN